MTNKTLQLFESIQKEFKEYIDLYKKYTYKKAMNHYEYNDYIFNLNNKINNLNDLLKNLKKQLRIYDLINWL